MLRVTRLLSIAVAGGALIWGDAQQLKLHQGAITWFPVAQARRELRVAHGVAHGLNHVGSPPKKWIDETAWIHLVLRCVCQGLMKSQIGR